MAYNYLGLCNDVNRRLNEVELTQSNFASAVGYYSSVKDAVNNSIAKINQEQYEWPFNHVTQELALTPGTTRYSFPSDAKTVDMSSFRIKEDSTLNNRTVKLRTMVYEDYLEKEQEYSTDNNSLPTYVFRSPSQEFGLYRTPDKAYNLVYEYYSNPVALSAYDDVPSIPEPYRYVIVEGAMYYSYLFRKETERAQISYQLFLQGIEDMKSLLINRFQYLRSTVIIR